MPQLKSLCPPFKGAKITSITQDYSSQHKAIDIASYYGDFLLSPDDCVVEKIITPDTFDGSTDSLARGYGISLKSIYESCYYLYWHALPIFPVKEGESVLKGDVICQMGNSGFVMANGKVVPLEDRTKKPYLGTHCHYEMLLNGQLVNPIPYIDFSYKINYNLNWAGQMITAIMKITQSIKNILKGRN